MKTIFKNAAVLFTCFTLSIQLFAATYEANLPGNQITGKVIDKSSGNSMEYVSIALYNSADSVLVTGGISDTEGNFSITKIDTGSYYLMFSSVGYSTRYQSGIKITKLSGKTDLGNIELSPALSELDEVKVVGERARIEYKIDKRVVNVEKDIAAKGGTAVTALENTPSVQVDGQGNLTLRGSTDYIVLVDGKPSIIKGSDALKQIPSNAIKQIEIITNPSAKYEADGRGGIINVIMKKGMIQGLNGNLSVSGSNTDKATAGVTVNYRKEKINLFGGFDFADNTYRDDIELDSKSYLPTETQTINGLVKEFSKNENLGFRGGFDWDVNEKNSFSLGASVSKQGYDNGSDAKTNLFFSSDASMLNTNTSVYLDVTGIVYGLNLDYTRKFNETGKLSITNNLGTWNGVDQNEVKEFSYDEELESENIRSMSNYRKDNHNYTYRFNIDFNNKLFSGEFEAGAQFRMEPRFEDFVFKNFLTDSDSWERSNEFSYKLDYSNSIYSGYSTYSGKLTGIDYKIGLRSEYFMRSIEFDTEEESIDYNKFMFYPSFHVSKEINEKNQLQASYSRRINRPLPWLLNKTPRFIDTRNIFLGSPYLVPEYTDAFELNYRRVQSKASYWTQLYYRNTSNSFIAIRSMNEEGSVIHQLANAKNQQAYGAEFGSDIKIFKWWQVNPNLNVYNYKLTTSIDNLDKVQKVVTWDARLTSSFNLKKGTRIQAAAYYRAPGVDAMGKSSGNYFMSLAVGQSLMKGKMDINLSGQNLFPRPFTYTVKTADFDNKYTIGFEGPSLTLNLTYNFNNFQNKQRGRSDDLQFKGSGGF